MATVWRRPSLTLLEVAWRWAAGLPLLAILAIWGMRIWTASHIDVAALEAMTFFQPVAAAETMNTAFFQLAPTLFQFAKWFVPLAVLWWTLAGALGRGWVARRMNPTLHRATATLFALGLLRLLGVVFSCSLWLAACVGGARIAIAGPVLHGGEPNVVLYMAIVIVSSLGIFTAWAVASWPMGLAMLLAMSHGTSAWASLRAATGRRDLRGPLAEISLVLCIVRMALLVLALVFSACPLPFQSVETQGFLLCWWAGVTVLYLLLSDYFHVVRLAAYQTLLAESAS